MNFDPNRSFDRDRSFIDLLPTSWFQLEINHCPFYTSMTSAERDWVDEHNPPVIRYDRPVNHRVNEFRRMSFAEKLDFLENPFEFGLLYPLFTEGLKRNPRYQLLKSLNEDENTPKKRKKKIPPSLRARVWGTYIGEKGISKCPCCDTIDITPFNFECGHIIAESKGGSTTIDNLRPVCGICNRSMGTMDMNEFIQTYFPKGIRD